MRQLISPAFNHLIIWSFNLCETGRVPLDAARSVCLPALVVGMLRSLQSQLCAAVCSQRDFIGSPIVVMACVGGCGT